jgi:hypothetical protein
VVSVGDAVKTLRASGAQVEVINPDDATEAALASVGGNLLNPAVGELAARAGFEQGRNIAHGHLATLWQ